RACCFFSSRRRHTRFKCDWSSDVCSSDLTVPQLHLGIKLSAEQIAQPARLLPRLRAVRALADGLGKLPHRPHRLPAVAHFRDLRSEERRVGKQCWQRSCGGTLYRDSEEGG